MTYITIDFETAYDSASKYSLRNLTVIEYVRDARFVSFGASVKVDSGVSMWLTHEQLVDWFATLDWPNVHMIGHNLMFDAFVLKFHYGYQAGMYIDTLKMARYCLGQSIKGHDLGSVFTAVTGRIGKQKVGALKELDGVFRPTPDQMARLGEYARDDADEAYEIFFGLYPLFPAVEYARMSWCISMFVDPKLMLDPDKLGEVHVHEMTEKEAALAKVGEDMKTIRSNDRFAELLTQAGLQSLPIKESKSTGKDTYAFAKTDKEFVDLLGDSDPRIRDLVAARLRVKTSIEETRAKRLTDVHRRMGGWLPVPLNYCGAMPTNRLSGCLVGDTQVLAMDRNGQTAYTSIVGITLDHLVWDGQAFVEHEGVKFSGYREVITYEGVTGTPDHVVFTEAGEEKPLSQACADGDVLESPEPPTPDEADAARRCAGRGDDENATAHRLHLRKRLADTSRRLGIEQSEADVPILRWPRTHVEAGHG